MLDASTHFVPKVVLDPICFYAMLVLSSSSTLSIKARPGRWSLFAPTSWWPIWVSPLLARGSGATEAIGTKTGRTLACIVLTKHMTAGIVMCRSFQKEGV